VHKHFDFGLNAPLPQEGHAPRDRRIVLVLVRSIIEMIRLAEPSNHPRLISTGYEGIKVFTRARLRLGRSRKR
jgi:hypothetical protein